MAPLFQFPTILIVDNNNKKNTWKLHVRVKFGHPPSDDNNSFVSLLF